MNENEQRSSNPEIVQRKPYERPMIIYRQPLEARAAVCTPHPPGKADATCMTAFS
jgi:hypothetical protein